jgi:deoxyribodipyrimidine photolyase-like uncharacterized protein
LDRKDQDELFKDAINQSLNFATHHIQRLMITNFALLAGVPMK